MELGDEVHPPDDWRPTRTSTGHASSVVELMSPWHGSTIYWRQPICSLASISLDVIVTEWGAEAEAGVVAEVTAPGSLCVELELGPSFGSEFPSFLRPQGLLSPLLTRKKEQQLDQH